MRRLGVLLGTVVVAAVLAVTGNAAAANTGELIAPNASKSGVVRATIRATVTSCEENEAAITEWEFGQEFDESTAPEPPCGGRLAIVAGAPHIGFRHGWLRPRDPECSDHLPGSYELWNIQEAARWEEEVYEHISPQPDNPPLRVIWRSERLTAVGEQPARTARLHLSYGLWPNAMLETPCLYLVYMRQVSGELPAEGCLPKFKEGVRKELCSAEYWREVWFQTLTIAQPRTAYPECGKAELKLRLAAAALGRAYRTRKHAPRELHALLAANRRMRVNCPKSSWAANE